MVTGNNTSETVPIKNIDLRFKLYNCFSSIEWRPEKNRLTKNTHNDSSGLFK